MTTLFISDLHLSEHHIHLNGLFNQFIDETLAQQQSLNNIKALYILGDFFDVWLGDDLASDWARGIAAKLAQLVNAGILVYFMHGNRDFFLGNSFMQWAKSTLLPDPTVIDLYGQRVLLKHGDDLCTEDRAYQRFRRIVRSAWAQRTYLSLPAMWRKYIASRIRKNSQDRGMRDIYAKISMPMVAQLLETYQANILIHGHTHCPQMTPRHIVLSDWHTSGNRLIATADGRMLLDYFS